MPIQLINRWKQKAFNQSHISIYDVFNLTFKTFVFKTGRGTYKTSKTLQLPNYCNLISVRKEENPENRIKQEFQLMGEQPTLEFQ